MNLRENVEGSRVGVIGGSIAGCSAALALGRLGCDVQIYERSSGALRDRGSGIAIPIPLRNELIAAGYLPAEYPSCEPTARWWVVDDGSSSGQIRWEQPSLAATNNWGVLWRSLRARVEDARYHDGSEVEAVDQDDDGAVISFADGSSERFDVVLGADGYRSAVRAAMYPGTRPEYAGYILWRGNFPEAELADRVGIERLDAGDAWLTVGFDGGHGVMYPIPDFEDAAGPNHRRINWAIYAPQPEGLDFTEPTSIPPGGVSPELFAGLERLLDESFPADYRPLFTSPREEVSIQPIYDEKVDSYVDGRIVLIGDAGTVSRPHTGSGATKAMQDALCLQRLGAEHGQWGDLLAAYDAERTTLGVSTVELGRRIGRDQVEQTPPWATMTPDDYDAWTKSTLSGEKLYFWGNAEDD